MTWANSLVHYRDELVQLFMDYRGPLVGCYTLIAFFVARKSVPTLVELALISYAFIALPSLPVRNLEALTPTLAAFWLLAAIWCLAFIYRAHRVTLKDRYWIDGAPPTFVLPLLWILWLAPAFRGKVRKLLPGGQD
jgi:hypothetical protein